MNPVLDEDLYNTIVLGGVPSPGVVTLTGFKRGVDWDVKPGGAEDGASTTRKGKPPAKGVAVLHLVYDPTENVDEITDFQDRFYPVLATSMDKNPPQALSAYHPDLALLGISQLVVENVGQLVHDNEGGARVSIDLLEYRPPKPKPARSPTPKGDGKVKGEPDKPDPNAALKAELAQALDQARDPGALNKDLSTVAGGL